MVYEAPAAHFRPSIDRQELERVRQRYALPDQFILFVGTLEPRKNLPRALNAYAVACRGLPHKFVIVGRPGWKHRRIFEAVWRLGIETDVYFLGYVADRDLPAMYALADLFLFPSLYEGFGLPVVEAMACGTPVVTTNTGALAEIAGDAAELVAATSVESIAEGIRHVLTDRNRAAALRERGLQRAATFSWQVAAEATIRVYQLVAGAPLTGEGRSRAGNRVRSMDA